MDNVPSIPVALEFRREQYGWTQAKMAMELRLQRSHYNEIIKGKRNLPLMATKLAYSIGVPAKVLLQLKENPMTKSKECKCGCGKPLTECEIGQQNEM